MRPLATFLSCVLLLAACSTEQAPTPTTANIMLFEGARLIAGAGGAPIEDSAFLIENDRYARVGKRGEIQAPPGASRMDLSGKTVVPALIDTHAHLGYADVKGMTMAAENYSRENVVDHLNRYAYYGIAAVLNMGTDRGDVPFQLREEPIPGAALFRTAFRGMALPNAGPGAAYYRDSAFGVTTEDEARKTVQELAARKVDAVKIWVDDRNGTVPKLPPHLYRAIIDEAHKHNLRVIAHVYYLADAKDLLRAGIDGFAHGVRDKDIDEELVALFKQRPDVFLIPNLPDRGDPEDLDWLSDAVPGDEIQRLRDVLAKRTPEAAERARQFFAVQARNLAKLNAAGVRIAFGTDAGTAIGWNAHTELSDMVVAGMTPAQVIVAATRTSAEILRVDQLGTVAAGKSADFIVLDANPLDNIKNIRRIASVYLRGKEVDRAGLRAKWTSKGTS